MIRWLRRVVGFVLVLLVTIVVILVGGYMWLSTSVPDYDGTVALDGLSGPVEIIRDGRTIPHIFATTTNDAYFALGYVHAQDRLWQMEMNRHVAQGRVAEIAGSSGLPVDKLVRTLGFYRLAEHIANRLSPSARAVFDAYAAGVNAFLETRKGALPPEFLIAGVDPELWRPADSIAWGKLMTLQLSDNWLAERTRLRFSARLSPKQLDDLWPDYADDEPTTLADLAPLYRRLADLAGSKPMPPVAEERGFSNEWVVDGSRTTSGSPLLANDPHLGYQAPNLWYLVRIEAPGLSLTGATVPGVPLILLGHNSRIAWGLTTTGSDVSDLYIERVDPESSDRYLTPNGPRPFDVREETINVRGGDEVTWTVRSTRHGPVVSDLWADEDLPLSTDHVLALQAAFLRDDDLTAQAVLGVNRAGNWDQLLAALRDYQAPQQNFVYADVDGNIGFIAPGLVPVRRKGDGWMPVPGWTDDFAWTGFIPFGALPQAFNPPSGKIVNANNAIVRPSYSYFLSREWEIGYRAERIEELLDEPWPNDSNLFADMQEDTLSGAARALLPHLLAVPTTNALAAEAKGLLASWDFRMFRDQPEPTIFTAWLRELNRALYADELGDLFETYWSLRPEVVLHILTDAPEWCDDIDTPQAESCDSRIALALQWATTDLAARYGPDPNGWLWALAHPAVFENQVLNAIPVLRSMGNLQIAADGGSFTIDRNAVDIRDAEMPFAALHGAEYRAIYDLADLSQSRFIEATGQSGNPLSPYYDSFLPSWRDFHYLKIAGDRDSLAPTALGVLTLIPKH